MTGMDIGREPALMLTAQDHEPTVDRRRLNLRWLACTVLTGLAGASLMGGALFIAFDRQDTFAELPRLAQAQAATPGVGTVGKADRINIGASTISSRQLIQETSVRHVGGKEFVKVVPYVRVTASLSPTRGKHAEQAPSFNPLNIFSESGEKETAGAKVEDDGQNDAVDISFSQFDPLLTGAEVSDTIALDEVERAVRETARVLPAGPGRLAPLAPVSPPSIDSLVIDPVSLLASHDISRLTAHAPANTTTVPKRPARQGLAMHATEDLSVEIANGDTLMSILVAHGATRGEAMDLVDAIDEEGEMPILRPGEEVRLTMAPALEDAERLRPVRVTFPRKEGPPLSVAIAELGMQMPIPTSLESAKLRRAATAPGRGERRANVYEGIYETGLSHDVPRDLVDELVRIFAFDVDFQRSVSIGDTLEVFYAETGEEEGANDPEILFAEIALRGETRRFYRFRAPDDGMVDYYDEHGTSAKKFLMRKPLTSGTFRSGFGMRRHPIMGYNRMHAGVDWSARPGTPIMAAGNGTVTFVDWKSGYGRHIEIRHANGYETSYSHMSGFADGLRQGMQVRQGQVIGYVGSTGMSTGPHLHYEVTVNGRHVDPMRIRLPRGRELDGRLLAAFENEKARIDALMNRAPVSTRMADVVR